MNYINFTEANCKNCYKCLRSCPVKAIKFQNQQAEIIEERCISCGHCLEICPQNARYVTSNLDIVKNAVLAGKKLIASIAPSFAGYIDILPSKVFSVLRKIGFSVVEETAVGAEVVSTAYKNYIKMNNRKNYITTACPCTNLLVEKYYPELIDYLIPVVSPMIAHGKMLRQKYGEECYIVFIGPCVGKKLEANEYGYERIIDAVLTFEELNGWLKELNINIENIEEYKLNGQLIERGKIFPLSGGIIEGIKEQIDKNHLKFISVTGIEECMELFESVKSGEIEDMFIEVSACRGSCIGGPSSFKNDGKYYNKLKRVKNYINSNKTIMNIYDNSSEGNISYNNLLRIFESKKMNRELADEKTIDSILKSMGKHSKSDELNCGVCGYNTCREKAQAVFEGMAETDMCLHFMRTKAESLANVIIENTANIIFLIDKDLNIVTINPAAEKIFIVSSEDAKGRPISTFIDDNDFISVRKTGENIIGKKAAYPMYNAVFIQNIVYLEKQDMILASMINVIETENQKKEMLKLKENTLIAAQEVIDKQMRVAQEIAGLLGETTAETKVILTQLKKLVAGEK